MARWLAVCMECGMKKFLIKTLVFLVTFVSAILVVSRVMNRDNNSMTKEMAKAHSLEMLKLAESQGVTDVF